MHALYDSSLCCPSLVKPFIVWFSASTSHGVRGATLGILRAWRMEANESAYQRCASEFQGRSGGDSNWVLVQRTARVWHWHTNAAPPVPQLGVERVDHGCNQTNPFNLRCIPNGDTANALGGERSCGYSTEKHEGQLARQYSPPPWHNHFDGDLAQDWQRLLRLPERAIGGIHMMDADADVDAVSLIIVYLVHNLGLVAKSGRLLKR